MSKLSDKTREVLKKIFPKSLMIYHVIDYYPAFLGERIRNIEKNDYNQADHIFVIGHFRNNETAWVRKGCIIDIKFFKSLQFSIVGVSINDTICDIIN